MKTENRFLPTTGTVMPRYADIATFMVLGFASTLGTAPGARHPRLQGWADRVRGRRSVSGEFDAMMAAAAAV